MALTPDEYRGLIDSVIDGDAPAQLADGHSRFVDYILDPASIWTPEALDQWNHECWLLDMAQSSLEDEYLQNRRWL